MSRLRVIEPGEPPQAGERRRHRRRARARPWRRLINRYWRWQAGVAEHPAFEPLRTLRVRRLLVVAFAV